MHAGDKNTQNRDIEIARDRLDKLIRRKEYEDKEVSTVS